MKVLLSAYRCEPGRGSEPGIGWNWALQVSRFHDTWVLTRVSNRPAIEDYLSRHPAQRLRFVYYDLLPVVKRLLSGLHYLEYELWQFGALRQARLLHQQVGFDLAHHVTYGAHRMPAMVAWLGVPTVWGPVGGAETAPLAFFRTYGIRGAIRETARLLHNSWVKISPLVSYTRKYSSLLLATSKQSAGAIATDQHSDVIVFPNIGVEPPPISDSEPPESSFRVLYAGNLLYWKGVSLALRAFARLAGSRSDVTLTVVGDGPDRLRLERLTSKLGIQELVSFRGRLTREHTLEEYRAHHVFLYPSLHDSGAMVVLEAMAAGLPVVCLDLGGPAVSVSSECGFKVPALTPEQAIQDMAGALTRLADDRLLLRQLGREAQARVAKLFVWDRKGEEMNAMYNALVSKLASGSDYTRVH